jgi:hypothetical protein
LAWLNFTKVPPVTSTPSNVTSFISRIYFLFI